MLRRGIPFRPMLALVHRVIHRRRRQMRWLLAILAVAATVVTAHSTLMNASMGDHEIGDAAALCVAVGGALAIAGVAGFAAARPPRRPTWLLAAVPEPATAYVPVASGFLVRAGPPDLQVFRF